MKWCSVGGRGHNKEHAAGSFPLADPGTLLPGDRPDANQGYAEEHARMPTTHWRQRKVWEASGFQQEGRGSANRVLG